MPKNNKKRNSRRRKVRSSEVEVSDAAIRGTSAVASSDQSGASDRRRVSSRKAESASGVLSESPTISPLLFGLLIALIATPAIFGPYGQRAGYSPDLHMAAYIQIFSFLLLALVFFSPHFSKRLEVPKAPAVIPFALLFAWAMLSVLWTNALYEAVTDALDWAGAFTTGFIVLLMVRNLDSVRKIIEAVAISGALLSVLGALQFLFGVDWVQQHVVPATTFSNKNMAGHYAILTLPLMAGMFLVSKDAFRIWLYAAAIAITGAFIFYTRARGVWVSTSIGLIVFLFFMIYLFWVRKYTLDGKYKKIAAALIIPMFLGLSYLTPGLLGQAETVKQRALGGKSLEDYDYDDGVKVLKGVTSGAKLGRTSDVRLTIWANSIPMFLDHPWFGVGMGNWTVYYAAYQSWFKQDSKYLVNEYHANAHNDYVELICELGIIGLILMLWCFIVLFIMLRALIFAKDTYDRTHAVLAGSLMIALVSIGINAVFSFPLKQPVQIMLVITYIALLCCLYSIKVSHVRYVLLSSSKGRAYISSAAGAVIAVITVLCVFLHYHWFQSEVYYRSMLGQSKGGTASQQSILKMSRLAHHHMPWRDRLLWAQGTSMLRLGNAKAALPLYQRVLESYPYQQNSLANITSTYMSLGKVQEALYYYRRLRGIQYRYSGYKDSLKMIDLLLRNGWYKQALEEADSQHDYYKYHYDNRLARSIRQRELMGKEGAPDNAGLDDQLAQLKRFASVRQYIKKQWDALEAVRAKAEAKQSESVTTEIPAENQ